MQKMLENLLDVTNSRTGSLVVRSLLEAGFSIGIDYSGGCMAETGIPDLFLTLVQIKHTC